jgi:GAF domain-containing protein
MPHPVRLSIFAHGIDRAAFVAYFLGAVVPLAALGWLTHVHVLPHLQEGRAAQGLVGLIVSVGVLSLVAFLALRRVARQSVARLQAQGQRLETLLEASHAVAQAPYGAEVCRLAARYVLGLARAEAGLVLALPAGEGEGPKLEGSAGAGAASLFAAHEPALRDALAALVAGAAPLGATRERGPWRGEGRRPAALAAAPLAQGGRVEGAIVALREAAGDGFEPAEIAALSTLAALVSVSRHNADLRDAERNFFAHVTELLVTALDASLDMQRGHARRVAYLSGAVGRALGLSEAELERLHFAALLHDIGMLRIDPGSASRTVYKQHPLLGYRMLKPIRLWERLAPLVLHHHEWFDGRGYPEGLAGEAIPLESRIIGVAEAFDSMTSARSYRQPVPVAEALAEVRKGAGTQFDPTVARAFLELAERGAFEVLASL